jgi:hypothetical protein
MSAILGYNPESIEFRHVDLMSSLENRAIHENPQQIDAFSSTKPDLNAVTKQPVKLNASKMAAVEVDDKKTEKIDIFKDERKFPCTVCIL